MASLRKLTKSLSRCCVAIAVNILMTGMKPYHIWSIIIIILITLAHMHHPFLCVMVITLLLVLLLKSQMLIMLSLPQLSCSKFGMTPDAICSMLKSSKLSI